MRRAASVLRQFTSSLPAAHRRGLIFFSLLTMAAAFWPTARLPVGERVVLDLDFGSLSSPTPVFVDDGGPFPDLANLEYVIQSGDTLSGIFNRLNLGQETMAQLLESDVDVLALDTLMPGNRLRFWIDQEAHRLNRLELYFNPARQVVFERVDSEHFTFDEVIHEGQWRERPARTEIHGSFYNAALGAGLSPGDVAQIETLFKSRVNFRRLQAGDELHLVRNEQFVGEQASGNTELLAVELLHGKRRFSAFLAADGNYYDDEGNSQTQAFLRYPLAGKPRVSSHFNPKRRHPVTGRIKPHNGTDFPLPIGTPVLAAGDGVVAKVENHQYAGRYVVIEFSSRYRARYLHLSKPLVRVGQRVSRGQVIALSGNTGRSTGPHLHYEFHVNGRPVDPMSAALPMMRLMSDKELRAYKARVNGWRKAIADSELLR